MPTSLHPLYSKATKFLKQGFITALLLVILYYTGLLSAASYYSQVAMLQTGVLDANTQPQDNSPFPFDFNLKKLDGSTVNIQTLKGKVIFLNIWATWCGPCRAEMANIQKIYSNPQNKEVEFVMLAIDENGEDEKVVSYLKKKGFTFTAYRPTFNPSMPLPDLLRVPSIPTTFVIDKDGNIAYEKVGMANYNTKKFQDFLQELVNK